MRDEFFTASTRQYDAMTPVTLGIDRRSSLLASAGNGFSFYPANPTSSLARTLAEMVKHVLVFGRSPFRTSDWKMALRTECFRGVSQAVQINTETVGIVTSRSLDATQIPVHFNNPPIIR